MSTELGVVALGVKRHRAYRAWAATTDLRPPPSGRGLLGAGFGTMMQASRMWDSGIFIATRKPFFFYLYKTGTGERVQKDLDLGTESRTLINAWGLDGGNLWQQRLLGGGTIQRNRTWVPLRNEGSKTHWVMESEVQVDGSGETVLISGATGMFGSAAVALALAMGAGCTIATGRNAAALARGEAI